MGDTARLPATSGPTAGRAQSAIKSDWRSSGRSGRRLPMQSNLTRREALVAILGLPALCSASTNVDMPTEAAGPPRPLDPFEDWTDVCHSMANMEATADKQHHPLTHHHHSYAGAIQFAPEVMLIYALCHQA